MNTSTLQYRYFELMHNLIYQALHTSLVKGDLEMQYTKERDFAESLARQSGTHILATFHSITSTSKDTLHADLVTPTDTLVQSLIQSALKEMFPGDGFIGEESNENEYDGFHGKRYVIDSSV